MQEKQHKTHMDIIDLPGKTGTDSAAMEFRWERSLKMGKWENDPTIK